MNVDYIISVKHIFQKQPAILPSNDLNALSGLHIHLRDVAFIPTSETGLA